MSFEEYVRAYVLSSARLRHRYTVPVMSDAKYDIRNIPVD